MKKLTLLLSFLLICVWQMKAENQVASVTWPLVNDTKDTPSYSGQLENAEMKLKGLEVYSYGGADATVVIMLEGGGSTVWHTAEKEDCYVEFSVTPKAGNKFTAKEISAYIAGKGGSHLRAAFYYSTDPTFTTKTQIDFKKETSLAQVYETNGQLQETLDVELEAGEKVYFRIYPYYRDGSTTGKYMCLKDIKISGETEATEVAASVTWPFISDLKPVVSGALLAQDMSYSTNTRQYGWDARVILPDGTDKVANGTFCTNTNDCAWTASTNIIDDVYVQYAVSPKVGATLTVTNLSLLISAAAGTNNMVAAVYASKDANFATKTELKAATDLVNEKLQQWDIALATPEVVATGETYYVRIYPYHKSDATNKLVGVRNVTISGTLLGATADPAEVSTVSAATYISTTTALAGGTVTNDGGATVTARGMVWGTSANPTIDNSKSVDGDGSGIFESTLSGLTAGTKYYTRAYATNKAGTSYGNEISFTTLAVLEVPTVATKTSSNVRNMSVEVSGDVTAWGGTDVTERGLVWGTETNPTIETNKVEVGSGLGTFKGYIGELTPETKYYIRAYAVNSTGVAYGNEISVTTKATDPDVTKIISQDGSGDYTTVQAAFDAVPSNYTGRWIIKIKPGTYTERPTLASGKVNVYLVGEDAETTIITNNISAGDINPSTGLGWGTSGCQTMAIDADDFMAVNITIENTFVNSKANEAINKNTQAVALRTRGDRQSFYNCKIKGYQDTYYAWGGVGRVYFKECYIEGNVDFIFGTQTVVFDQCTTYVNRDESVLTAPSTAASSKFGMVFLDCDLTAPSTSYVDFNGKTFKTFFYGRPWQNNPKSAFIRCNVPATLNEKGWSTMNGGLNPVFVEYGCTGDGAAADRLAKRANEGKVITAQEAEVFTVSNIFKKTTDPAFTADWMPKEAPDSDLNTSITNDKVDGKTFASYCTPNPIVDSFSINYTLDSDSDVNINLYTIDGKLVSKLTEGKQSAGTHSLQCNGASLASGVYFYSISTNAGAETQRIIKN
ncbi:pectinesterase family protein [Dysgonomonas sp. 520]|uniref:pectinesterase family protein n=1 Tax=Dysgonomonas sp. 520 TaxID=2302931 RepID=UPI0013D13D35|nr:pectinesterase family protein [Dysgonomonas sp. 520]NDW09920.1 T9SS C-terminal target domain-containing protein [Dysgonomonas sp. 520]